METVETISERRVVSLEERKIFGSITGVRFDAKEMSVSHYLVGNPRIHVEHILPVEKAIAVGDTFITIQSRDALISAGDAAAKDLVENGFQLVGTEVYSKVGNQLGVVASFEFDPLFSRVTSITLDSDLTIEYKDFIFFDEQFIFVDDGSKTAAEMRAIQAAEEEAAPVVIPSDVELTAAPKVATREDKELMSFLVGTKLKTAVTSDDGEFKARKGSVLTREAVEKAFLHDALVMLTMSIED